MGHHGILINPADAGRVGAERRRHARRQIARCRRQIFEHPRTCPVDIGAVVENHVDERYAEKREAAHHARARNREHGGRKRISDLVLDDLRRLPGILGVDDDLGIREVGDGIERHVAQGIEPRGGGHRRTDQHQHEIAGRPANDTGDHGFGLGVLCQKLRAPP